MLFPIGATVIYRREARTAVGYCDHPHTLKSLDGGRIMHEPAVRVRPAP